MAHLVEVRPVDGGGGQRVKLVAELSQSDVISFLSFVCSASRFQMTLNYFQLQLTNDAPVTGGYQAQNIRAKPRLYFQF
jgi:hypothetical protein